MPQSGTLMLDGQKVKLYWPTWTPEQHREYFDPVAPKEWFQFYKCVCGGTAWNISPTFVDENQLKVCLMLTCTACNRSLAIFEPLFADHFRMCMEDMQEEENEKPPNERKCHWEPLEAAK